MGSREKLTVAMAELLWEQGFAATSPRDVMARAGVGQGSMYHHFSGKKELAIEAMTSVAADLVGATSTLDGPGSPLQRLKDYLLWPRPGVRGCRVGRLTQDPHVVADPELRAVVADAFTAMLKRWESVIQEAVDCGELAPTTDAAVLARTLSAVIQGGYVLARALGDQAAMDDAVGGAAALLDAARQL